MINLRLSIEYPWCDRFRNIKNWAGSTPFQFKFWEVQVMKTNDVVTVDLRVTTRYDHAGVNLWLGLLGYSISFEFYDSRHWDYNTNRWTVYPNESE